MRPFAVAGSTSITKRPRKAGATSRGTRGQKSRPVSHKAQNRVATKTAP